MISGEVSARLGIDSSGIAADMDKATAAFTKSAGKAGESAGANFGDNFNKRLEDRFIGRAAMTGLFAAFGVSAQGIADTIAGAIVGGSKQGWEEAIQEADKYEQSIKEHFKLTSTKGEQEAALKREIKSAEAELSSIKPQQFKDATQSKGDEELHGARMINYGLTADQLTAQEAANDKRQRAMNELTVLQKEDTKAAEEYNQIKIQDLPPLEKAVALKKEEHDLGLQLVKDGTGANPILSLSEQYEIKKKILEISKQIAEVERVEIKDIGPLSEKAKVAKVGVHQSSAHVNRAAITAHAKAQAEHGRGGGHLETLQKALQKHQELLSKIESHLKGKFANQ